MNHVDLNILTFNTLSELIENTIRRYGKRPAFGTKKNGHYNWITYSDFGSRLGKLRAIFQKSGVRKGDRIAIISNNSLEFALSIYAAYGLGAIVVPMYEVQKVQDWEFILSDADPKLLVVANPAIREKIEPIRTPNIARILVMHTNDPDDPESLENLIRNEKDSIEPDKSVAPDDIADIIYTSGTTGKPRGVELTHKNFVANTKATLISFDVSCKDRTLSFLPWAHAFGKLVELHIMVGVGFAIGIAESSKTILENLKEIQPTVMTAVPKIFNKIYDKVNLSAQDNPLARRLIDQTVKIGGKVRHNEARVSDKIQFFFLNKFVASKIREIFTPSLRFCISGGASLSPEIATFFESCGITVCEGFGMTEHSPIVSVNTFEDHRIGSVGKPLPGVKVEIERTETSTDEDEKLGEIVITSDCVMKGYHNAPEATLAAIDDKGRLHTGDMGYLDQDGFLWITGRVKEQYKLENGKYVVPTALEEKLNNIYMIAHAVVFGAGKPYNVALIRPDNAFIDKFKKSHHLENTTQAELENNAELRQLVLDEMKKVFEGFRGYEKPQKFALTLEDFTIENGLLTPALKLKRREIEKRFAQTLADLYQ